MHSTTVPVFVDTNIAVYAFGLDAAKKAKGRDLLARQPTISTQVVNEFLNVCRVKLKLEIATRHALARELIAGCDVVVVDSNVVGKAMTLEAQTGLSYWDCLIVASALLSGCGTLYSEDMQHGQIFEGRLTVLNPFLG
ncbi:MAG: VapC toxin family PIN domain ribonuclease [Hydrogenophilales bacterium CG_4_10_14_3_um_filter_63_21]|nr:MAG: VapC toxin family PIN domain ribonuclease [Hydrogenophilales bacterium CG_4_10_14_3_um_filter_63_21]